MVDNMTEPKYMKTRWVVYTTSACVAHEVSVLSFLPSLPNERFTACRGRATLLSVKHTSKFAHLVWKGMCGDGFGCVSSGVLCPVAAPADAASPGDGDELEGGHVEEAAIEQSAESQQEEGWPAVHAGTRRTDLLFDRFCACPRFSSRAQRAG